MQPFEIFFKNVPYQNPPLLYDISELNQWRKQQQNKICSSWKDDIGPCQIGSNFMPLEMVNIFPQSEYLKNQLRSTKKVQESMKLNKKYGCLLTNYENQMIENAYLCQRNFFSPDPSIYNSCFCKLNKKMIKNI